MKSYKKLSALISKNIVFGQTKLNLIVYFFQAKFIFVENNLQWTIYEHNRN